MCRAVLVLLLLPACPVILAQPAVERAEAARQLLLAGKLEQAISEYRALVAAAPNNADMLLNLAIAEYRAKHYQDAIRHGESAIRLRPDLYPAYLFVGASYLQQGDAEKAAPPLEKAVAGMQSDRNARLMLAEALLLTRRYRVYPEDLQRSKQDLLLYGSGKGRP
jgi:tetratricopeptide (TPR) repeat protein